jgi:hypothetical protein
MNQVIQCTFSSKVNEPGPPLEHAAEVYEVMMSGKARFRAIFTTGH